MASAFNTSQALSEIARTAHTLSFSDSSEYDPLLRANVMAVIRDLERREVEDRAGMPLMREHASGPPRNAVQHPAGLRARRRGRR